MILLLLLLLLTSPAHAESCSWTHCSGQAHYEARSYEWVPVGGYENSPYDCVNNVCGTYGNGGTWYVAPRKRAKRATEEFCACSYPAGTVTWHSTLVSVPIYPYEET